MWPMSLEQTQLQMPVQAGGHRVLFTSRYQPIMAPQFHIEIGCFLGPQTQILSNNPNKQPTLNKFAPLD